MKIRGSRWLSGDQVGGIIKLVVIHSLGIFLLLGGGSGSSSHVSVAQFSAPYVRKAVPLSDREKELRRCDTLDTSLTSFVTD